MTVTASRAADSSSDQRATKWAASRKQGWRSGGHAGNMQHATYSRRAAKYSCHIHQDQLTFFTVWEIWDHNRPVLKDITMKTDLFEDWRLRWIKQQFTTWSYKITFLPDAINGPHASKPIITFNWGKLMKKNIASCFPPIIEKCLNFVSVFSTLCFNGCWPKGWKVDFQLISYKSLEMITLAHVHLVSDCNSTPKVTWTEMLMQMCHKYIIRCKILYLLYFHSNIII